MAEVRADAEPRTRVRADERAPRRERAAEPRLGLAAAALGSGPMGLRPVAGFAAAALVVAAVAGYAIGGGIGSGEGGGDQHGRRRQAAGRHREDGQRRRQRHAAAGQRATSCPSDRVLEAWVQRDGEVEPVRALFVPDREGRASTESPT